ncbi:Uncharacterized protein TCM_027477 [Theobroma cacao]|uniref:Uncharacterized protein n=1 Tax=Theobroma cacao TaxID=3641 RepID=A0A061G949_THECC|nr:Uncharacterized protein TCM_027477 [Theobroma cacao]
MGLGKEYANTTKALGVGTLKSIFILRQGTMHLNFPVAIAFTEMSCDINTVFASIYTIIAHMKTLISGRYPSFVIVSWSQLKALNLTYTIFNWR